MSEFECDKCGECCRHVGEMGQPYAWFLNEKGQCRYFNSDGSECAVYKLRPLLCRVEEGYALYFSHLDYGEYLRLNAEACCKLKEMAGKMEKPIPSRNDSAEHLNLSPIGLA